MGRIENRLRELGHTLPAAKPPVANYLGTKRSGDLLFVSGRVSQLRGEVGSDLDRIVSVENLRGFVRASSGFIDHPRVIDGASDLLVQLWGEAGRHARTATGAASLPFGAAVQIELILRLAP